MTIYTIGVYGFTEEDFFGRLRSADIDLLCDIRARRGVRGAAYAFANSKRLQERLADLGIAYRHIPRVAPSERIRALQSEADSASRTARRKRNALSPEFIDAYRAEVLSLTTPEAVAAELVAARATGSPSLEGTAGDLANLALMCVEGSPEACHRSLLADFVAPALKAEVEHLLP